MAHPVSQSMGVIPPSHEVLHLPPYHCDLNAIELIWADEKNFVAHENKEMTLKSVEKLFR